MGSIQESFNQVIGSAGALKKMVADVALTAATGGAGAGALIKDIAGDGAGKAVKAAKPMTEYQKENIALRRDQLDLAKSKAEVSAAKETRKQEELLDKQIRTASLKTTREADAGYTNAATEMLKEKTAQEALKRKEEEYKFRQKKARDKKAQERKRAQESALGEYTSNVEALNGQKIGMKQRKEMLQNAEQIQLEI